MTKKADPVEAEVAGATTVDVDFNGHTYTLPRDVFSLPVAYLEAIDGQKYGIALRILLGDAEWERFKANGNKVIDCFKMMTAHEVALGLRPGE